MKLSVVIVSWNTRQLLHECLTALYAELDAYPQELQPAEVWVVDNDSSDGSPQMVATDFPQAHLILNHSNPGFASANNQALRQAKGKYLWLLNPDTRPLPQSAVTLVRFLDSHPGAGAAGSHLLNPDGSLQISSYPFPTPFREAWRLFHLDRLIRLAAYPDSRWTSTQPQAVDVLQGASLMLRKAATDQTGLLDDQFFMYTEEVDLCYRIQRAGWTLHWLPNSQVIHYGGQSTRQAAQAMFLQLNRSKLQYLRKHHGNGAAIVYKLVLLLASLPRVIAGWLRPRLRPVGQNYAQLIRAIPHW